MVFVLHDSSLWLGQPGPGDVWNDILTIDNDLVFSVSRKMDDFHWDAYISELKCMLSEYSGIII